MGNTRGLRRLAAAIAVAAMALLAAVGTAQAAIDLPNGMTVSNNDDVVVEGVSLPAGATGATHVTAALCDLDGAEGPADLGTRCKEEGAVGFTALSTFNSTGVEVEDVQDAFANFDFTIFDDGVGTTECASAGEEDCGIVVSYYVFTPAPTFLTAEAEEVTFE